MSRRVYRGTNHLGVMTPLFCLVFAGAMVFVIVSVFLANGPPWWFALLWCVGAGFAVWLNGYWLATKVVLEADHLRWSYLLRRGGSRNVGDIISVGAYGWAWPGWIEFDDEQKVWIMVTFGFRRFARAIGQLSPNASIEV